MKISLREACAELKFQFVCFHSWLSKMVLDFSLTTVCPGSGCSSLRIYECSSSPAVIGNLFHITVFGKDTLCDFSLKSVKDLFWGLPGGH